MGRVRIAGSGRELAPVVATEEYRRRPIWTPAGGNDRLGHCRPSVWGGFGSLVPFRNRLRKNGRSSWRRTTKARLPTSLTCFRRRRTESLRLSTPDIAVFRWSPAAFPGLRAREIVVGDFDVDRTLQIDLRSWVLKKMLLPWSTVSCGTGAVGGRQTARWPPRFPPEVAVDRGCPKQVLLDVRTSMPFSGEPERSLPKR